MKEVKTINFKSPKRETPFAPEWDYLICEKMINDINIKNLKSFLLKKEKEIKKLPEVDDGYTGLKNSTTSRFPIYNVFNWKNKEINLLKNYIIKLHNYFLKIRGFKKPKHLFANCWFNCMEKGEHIKMHLHGTSPKIYLGGHFVVACNNTSTFYVNPVNQINNPVVYESKNKIGLLTMFENTIPHYTNTHNEKEKRITIAFDLRMHNNHNNLVKLY
jgi:hypothetical protein